MTQALTGGCFAGEGPLSAWEPTGFIMGGSCLLSLCSEAVSKLAPCPGGRHRLSLPSKAKVRFTESREGQGSGGRRRSEHVRYEFAFDSGVLRSHGKVGSRVLGSGNVQPQTWSPVSQPSWRGGKLWPLPRSRWCHYTRLTDIRETTVGQNELN